MKRRDLRHFDGFFSRAGFFTRAGFLILAVFLTAATPAAAQFPGVITGRVTDATTGEPVVGATVELLSLAAPAASVRSGSDGAYTIEGVEPGTHGLRASGSGYVAHEEAVRVRNGTTTRVDIRLYPRVFDAGDIRVRVSRPDARVVLEREEIRASGARTAGEVLERVPGVVVREEGGAGPSTASIRGSDAAHVLVVLDGAVLNDPVTGVADLSSIPTATIASITVHPGARSTRYGAGAMAGVIVIESRSPDSAIRAASTLGSLGERRGSLGAGLTAGDWAIDATVHGALLDGTFDFRLPPEAGGGAGTRANADLEEAGGLLSVMGDLAGGSLRLRAGGDRIRRGLPGKGYAPSPHARQEVDRYRAAASWDGELAGQQLELAVQGIDQRLRHHDSDPPAGPAYDQRSRVGELRAEAVAAGDALASPTGPTARWRAGTQLSTQRIRSDALDASAPARRFRAGVFVGGEASLPLGATDLDVGLTGRVDRDDAAELHPSYSATAGLRAGRVRLHAAARSSFTPPSLADQFFRQGVAVEPNPELRGERVPLEVEVGARARLPWPEVAEAGVSIFRGDVRDMIVWAPDFRFVWRPHNTDVRRYGGEAWAEAGLGYGLRAHASYALAVVTYDTPGSTGAQLAYRPRHTGRTTLEWSYGPWSASLAADYTGERYPTAARVNRLPPYWRTQLGVAGRWTLDDWRVGLSARADRLLDEKDTMIFGYPEPGRTLQLQVDLERALRAPR